MGIVRTELDKSKLFCVIDKTETREAVFCIDHKDKEAIYVPIMQLGHHRFILICPQCKRMEFFDNSHLYPEDKG